MIMDGQVVTRKSSCGTDSKLHDALQVACDVQALAKDIVDGVSTRLQEQGQALNWRSRVLVGLALKLYRTFECLVEDARKERSEAMHHLKTLVETFIYFHWVAKDTGETRARLIYAEGCHNKKGFFKRNPSYYEPQLHASWEESFKIATRGLGGEWKKFKERDEESKRRGVGKLADEAGPQVDQWYQRVYRMACEPAHITDLPEHMPETSGKISLDLPHTSRLQAYIALDYGLHIIFELMKDASKEYKLGLEEKIGKLEAQLTALRSQ
jgi:hypothetical protein